MSSAQDPFYIVKEEIQDSIDKLLSTFNEWETLASDVGKKGQLSKSLLSGCESIQWQVDELDKAVSVAARDPAFYGINEAELERRRKWTKSARDKVATVRMAVGKGLGYQDNANGNHREIMRYPVDDSTQKAASSQYPHESHDNDDFVSSESDRQLLLMRQQDQELDELTLTVERIGHVGYAIHGELMEQEKIMDDLGTEIDSTSNRLEFLQKKVAFVMKKAGAKGQIMIIFFLLVLFIILFVLVFLT